MPKRTFWFMVFALLISSTALAQDGIIPGAVRTREGTSNNTIPYDALSSMNVAYMQFQAPSEFCVNPPDCWTGGTAPGSGLLEPAFISGMQVRPDGPLAGFFTATHTRPNAGTFSFLTDLQMNSNLLWFQDSLNWNATTVMFPGGFTLSFPTGANPAIPGTENFTPLTQFGAGFTYLGSLTGCCGSCPSVTYGGFLSNFRAVSGSGSGTLVADADFTFSCVGIHYNSIRTWGVGAGASGFTSWAHFFYGLVYGLGAGGCKTYADLKDEILNAVITGNDPSNPPGGPSGTDKGTENFQGIRNSLWVKAINSEAAFNRGQFGTAGNVLDALTHHTNAQDGKHLDGDSAQDLRNCIRSLKAALGLP